MKKLKPFQLMERIQGTWDNDEVEPSWMDIFANVIEGTVISNQVKEIWPHRVVFGIIENPTYQITDSQLCQIMDEGNHCISNGSITYEQNYAYITWSNLGHI